ncbi:phage shock envelope stress response protein PspM [Actinophytocola sediminis]
MRGREIYQLTKLANRYANGQVGQVMQQVQSALAARGDEAAKIQRHRRKLERRRIWASRWATMWALICAIGIVLAVAAATGVIIEGTSSAVDQASAVIFGIAMALVTGTFAVRATRKMTLIKREQRKFDERYAPADSVGAAAPPAALPPKGSSAREPIQRLAEAEAALDKVLAQLAGGGGQPASVPAESVEQARATSVEAATALRAVAAQLVAVELARDHAPPLERGPLVEGVARLREQLDEGLDGYRSLVAAAGGVVAASSSAGPNQELTDATDHLAGLAAALRELSQAGG